MVSQCGRCQGLEKSQEEPSFSSKMLRERSPASLLCLQVRKVGWELVAKKDLETDSKAACGTCGPARPGPALWPEEPRPATSQSVNSGTLVSPGPKRGATLSELRFWPHSRRGFESAASQASLIYCSSANSLRCLSRAEESGVRGGATIPSTEVCGRVGLPLAEPDPAPGENLCRGPLPISFFPASTATRPLRIGSSSPDASSQGLGLGV